MLIVARGLSQLQSRCSIPPKPCLTNVQTAAAWGHLGLHGAIERSTEAGGPSCQASPGTHGHGAAKPNTQRGGRGKAATSPAVVSCKHYSSCSPMSPACFVALASVLAASPAMGHMPRQSRSGPRVVSYETHLVFCNSSAAGWWHQAHGGQRGLTGVL